MGFLACHPPSSPRVPHRPLRQHLPPPGGSGAPGWGPGAAEAREVRDGGAGVWGGVGCGGGVGGGGLGVFLERFLQETIEPTCRFGKPGSFCCP